MHSHSIPFSGPWIPDQNDGTYRNPIIYADYSDPDVIRVGDDFYLTASSFNCTPGLPLLHSKDLVNWTLIGHALKNLPHPRYAAVQAGCGVWAPAFRFHAGKFWIFFPTPDEGIYLTTATHPEGPWTEPHLVQAGRGLIDPCPLWDDDGTAWLVHAYARSRSGIQHVLRVRPMAPDGSRLLGEGQVVFSDPARHPILEGPKFLKRDGWYYLSAPAGGVQSGWQVVLRAKNIFGPYEDKIVLAQGSTPVNGPHQGALVEAKDGRWWFVHFQDAGLYGRITHLQPVEWKDGWPLMGHQGEPVAQHPKPVLNGSAGIQAPQTSDEFDSAKLGWQWQWQANHQENWFSLTANSGRLRLFSQAVPGADLSQAPNLLLQKFPARVFAVETALEFAPRQTGEECGLVVAGRDSAALAVRYDGRGLQLFRREGRREQLIQQLNGPTLRLRVRVAAGGICHFSFAESGQFVPVTGTFQANAGEWIGAKVGVYSMKSEHFGAGGHADFEYFRFIPDDRA